MAKVKLGSLERWLGRPICKRIANKFKVCTCYRQKYANIDTQLIVPQDCVNTLTTTSKKNETAKVKLGSLEGWLGRPICKRIANKFKVCTCYRQKYANIDTQMIVPQDCVNTLTTTSKKNETAKVKLGSLEGWLGRPICKRIANKSKVCTCYGQKYANIDTQLIVPQDCVNTLTTTSKKNETAKVN